MREERRAEKKMEMTRGVGKTEIDEQGESDVREKVFCMWRLWTHYLLL